MVYKRKHGFMCSSSIFNIEKAWTWRMCVYYHAINNIMVKYRHPIHRLDDMLDELHRFCVFSKIDLNNVYH